MDHFRPDTVNQPDFTTVENIIPGIKPPLPLEPRQEYKAVRPADASADILETIEEGETSVLEFLQPFSGQILVELGPGEMHTGYNIALRAGARAYVGVEPFAFIDNLQRFLKNADGFTPKSAKQITRTAIKADALSFLRRLPDRSVSIFASQLESVMWGKYQADVEKEIERVLHVDGALIQYDPLFKLNKGLFKHDRFDKPPRTGMRWDLDKFQLKT